MAAGSRGRLWNRASRALHWSGKTRFEETRKAPFRSSDFTFSANNKDFAGGLCDVVQGLLV